MSSTFLRDVLCFGLEALVDGQMKAEIEHTYYALLDDFGELANASSKEHQEQWEIKIPKSEGNAGEGKLRIRKTESEGQTPDYILTVKVKSGAHHFECEIPTSEDMFGQFRFLSESGMVKERYCFPVSQSDLKWEVDVFRLPNGEYCPWVKVDLEVPHKDTPIPEFPLQSKRLITAPYGKRTPEDEALISGLYQTEFTVKNPNLKQT